MLIHVLVRLDPGPCTVPLYPVSSLDSMCIFWLLSRASEIWCSQLRNLFAHLSVCMSMSAWGCWKAVSKGQLQGRLCLGLLAGLAMVGQRDKDDEDTGVIPEGHSCLWCCVFVCGSLWPGVWTCTFVFCMILCDIGGVLCRDWTVMIHVSPFQLRMFYNFMNLSVCFHVRLLGRGAQLHFQLDLGSGSCSSASIKLLNSATAHKKQNQNTSITNIKISVVLFMVKLKLMFRNTSIWIATWLCREK